MPLKNKIPAAHRGPSEMVQARVCRSHVFQRATSKNAEKVSEALPFLEYELQRQLMLKLKVLGMNAAFCFESSVEIGATMMVGTATATAVYLEPLPPPPRLEIVRRGQGDGLALNRLSADDERRLSRMQAGIEAMSERNRTALLRANPSRESVSQLVDGWMDGWMGGSATLHQLP